MFPYCGLDLFFNNSPNTVLFKVIELRFTIHRVYMNNMIGCKDSDNQFNLLYLCVI